MTDDDDEYEEAGGGNHLLGFMFGNVDYSGDLDVDYLDEVIIYLSFSLYFEPRRSRILFFIGYSKNFDAIIYSSIPNSASLLGDYIAFCKKLLFDKNFFP